jgi:hypothetical protein
MRSRTHATRVSSAALSIRPDISSIVCWTKFFDVDNLPRQGLQVRRLVLGLEPPVLVGGIDHLTDGPGRDVRPLDEVHHPGDEQIGPDMRAAAAVVAVVAV